jgi:hypothetical protein
MMADIKKLSLFLLQAIVVLYLIDLSFGKLFESLYDRMKIGEKARANYFIKQSEADVVVFGSSRALYHYHSGILADSLKTSVYNAGRSNQTILYHLALLKASLKRYTPKLIILDVNEDEFVKAQRKYEYLSALLPYCKYDNDIRKIYTQVNPNYTYWSWSHLLPYNSSAFAILYRGLINKSRDKDISGYLKHNGKQKGDKKTVDNCSRRPETDPILEASFQEFVSLCRDKNIPLVVTISPRYTSFKCERRDLSELKKAAGQMNITIFDFSELLSDPDLFADPAHLNSRGAIEYTQTILKTLRSEQQIP